MFKFNRSSGQYNDKQYKTKRHDNNLQSEECNCTVLAVCVQELERCQLVGHVARKEVTWYRIGVYYWRCVVSRGTHVIARHDDEVFYIEWNHYTRSRSEYYVLGKLRYLEYGLLAGRVYTD